MGSQCTFFPWRCPKVAGQLPGSSRPWWAHDPRTERVEVLAPIWYQGQLRSPYQISKASGHIPELLYLLFSGGMCDLLICMLVALALRPEMTSHWDKFTTRGRRHGSGVLVEVETSFSTLIATSASPEGTCKTTGGGTRSRRRSDFTGVIMGIVAPMRSEGQLIPRG
jgi:hypothetical protein